LNGFGAAAKAADSVSAIATRPLIGVMKSSYAGGMSRLILQSDESF